MIKKKSNAYGLIKNNIVKLTIVQQATGISPNNLVNIFLKTHQDSDLKIKKKTKEGYWDWELSSKSAYKYFKRESEKYLEQATATSGYLLMLDHIRDHYLTRDYFGMEYREIELTYRSQEAILKDFVREAFIAIFPITPEMTSKEKAIRNQKLGKISVKHWIGDIVNYKYYEQAPGFMMENVRTAISRVELYVLNVLHERELDHDLGKLMSNQNLQTKLIPKESAKNKINKI